jgi:hypothetical protein
MEESTELIEIGLIVVTALAVGITSASFSCSPSETEWSCQAIQRRTLFGKFVRALVPAAEQSPGISPQKVIEILSSCLNK